MALLTKKIEEKLQAQYYLGSDLENQDIICRIYNAFGPGCWYLINQDPEDKDYLWCIATFDRVLYEVGSVLRSELESARVGGVALIIRDRYFREINAYEAYQRLMDGEHL